MVLEWVYYFHVSRIGNWMNVISLLQMKTAMEILRKCDQALYLILWVGSVDEATCIVNTQACS